MSTAASSPPGQDASSLAATSPAQAASPPASGSPPLSSLSHDQHAPAHSADGASSSSTSTTPQSDLPTPLFERSSSSASSTRPLPPTRSVSYKADGDPWHPAAEAAASSARSFAHQDNATQRTARAASDGAILGAASSFSSLSAAEPAPRAAGGASSRLSSLGSDDAAADEQAFYREHQRRSLEHSASQRLSTAASKNAFSPPLASARLAPHASPFFAPPPQAQQSFGGMVSPTSSTHPTPGSAYAPLLSPTSTSPPSSVPFPSPSPPSSDGAIGPPGSRGTTLHLGDLDAWMDEAYVRECCALMGWDAVSAIKMSRGASPASGYCFLTFPSAAAAQRALARFNSAPPMLMPRSGRTFKLNWGTGLPGLQPRWDGEYSVFVGDLAREVGEADLMTLFTPLFPSTKSAKVMCDPSTGLSRGYGFVRFTDEADMARALRVGANAHSGLLLHGRTIRISEASGPGSSAAANAPPSAVEGMPHLRERERTRTRSGEGQFAAQQQQAQAQQQGQQPQQQGYFPPYPPQQAPVEPQPQLQSYPDHSAYASPALSSAYGGAGPAFPSPLSPYGGAPPALGPAMASPSLARTRDGVQQQVRTPIPQGAVPPGGDPNNTTVFVGGLPACISEETLKSFFHHFGEITYCKIPPGKGCGFVQFVRRQDAELAIAKMNDFPIHGKSRIRLSWGRSQGDKQVEHVRKLASALGVPFDAVWRMVQGQDNSTIKQIASAVGSNGAPASGQGSPPQQQQQQQRAAEASATSRMDLRAVANAAGLSESEVLDLVKNGSGLLSAAGLGAASAMPTHTLNGGNGGAASSHSNSTAGSDFFARSAVTGSATSLESAGPASSSPPSGEGAPRAGGQNPYSRVSPSSFSSAFGAAPPQHAQHHPGAHQQQGGMLPLSPPPTAGPTNGGSSFAHHQAQHPAAAAGAYGGAPPQAMHQQSPYTAIRPESYLVQPPAQSPYERVDFADGGRPSPNGFVVPPPHQHGQGGQDRYQPQGFGFNGVGGGKWQEQPHAYDGGNYTTAPLPMQHHQQHQHHQHQHLDDAFGALNLGANGGVGSPPRSLPPPVGTNARHAFQPTAPDFFPGALASPTTQGAIPPGAAAAGEANWSWGGVSAA
ncbi:hypothetical protein JCM10449v2_001374 [Rhodotorula kratochvilovae]